MTRLRTAPTRRQSSLPYFISPFVKRPLYARISTHDQQTLPLQVKAMRQYARRRSWKVVKAVEDVGSGASERPQREELIKAARRRRKTLVIDQI